MLSHIQLFMWLFSLKTVSEHALASTSAFCSFRGHFNELRNLPRRALSQLAQFGRVRRSVDGTLRGEALQHIELVSAPHGGHALRISIHVHQGSTSILSAFDRFNAHPNDSRVSAARIWKREKSHPLSAVMELLLREKTEFKDMTRQLVCEELPLNLGNVLGQIEASPELPEAPQPQGFAKGIQLHKYQRQTLKWMCDAEDTKLREKLWICVHRKV